MTQKRLDWSRLLNTTRLQPRPEPAGGAGSTPGLSWFVASRDESERDLDRILYAACTRRLGDKTQVFPLDRTDTVRNRLTHSHEVANLARSIGTHLTHSDMLPRMMADSSAGADDARRERFLRRIPVILAAAGLAHDMGNPPFGHQGEEAMRSWYKRTPGLFSPREGDGAEVLADLGRLGGQHRNDFERFDGNAQTIRTLTRLQVVKDDRGMNLTFGTIATLLKYTVGSDRVGPKDGKAAARKFGFFASEAKFIETVRDACGLAGETRHPLTCIMEACDDIAYLVVDAEDAIKKRTASFADLLAWLEDHLAGEDGKPDELIGWLVEKGKADARQARKAKVPPSEVNDVAMQVFRANAITAMVSATINAFRENYDVLMTTGLDRGLLEVGPAKRVAVALKGFDTAHAYLDRRVLEIELNGSQVIDETMTMLWKGISEREDFNNATSRRKDPFARYAYGRISENYRRVFERTSPSSGRENPDLPIRYRELQLLSDMIAGMTDRFAIDLHRELKAQRADAVRG